MSAEEKITRVECPFCKTVSDSAYDSIADADAHPEVRNAILSGKFFRWVCPNCGQRVRLCQRLFYCDRRHGFLLFLEPGASDGVPTAFDENKLFDRPEWSGFVRRTVSDINQLKEKILLLEAKIDDRAMELSKLVLSRLVEQKYDKPVRSAYFNKFDEVAESIGVSFQLVGEGRMIQFQTKLEVYQLAMHLADAFDETQAHTDHFRMIDRKWAENVLTWDAETNH